ncbi:MAG: DUF4367 domain-containing protein [Lachnospiraceae bacterium]
MNNDLEKKLSEQLIKQLNKEALEIEAAVNNNSDIADVEVPANMHELVMKKIEDYEAETRSLEGLSNEDKEALEIGRKIKKYKKKKTKMWFVLAAVLVLVLGMGVTSLGSKQYILDVVNKVLGNDDVVTVNTDNSDRKYTETAEENAAYQEIYNEFGFKPPQFRYMPQGLIYDSCEIRSDIAQVKIFYIYNKKNSITYNVATKAVNISYNMNVDDLLIEKYQTKVKDHIINMEIREIKETKETMCIAKFNDSFAFYNITGVLGKNEFEKIINNLYFD